MEKMPIETHGQYTSYVLLQKGENSMPIDLPSHLSGLNSSASGPHISARRFIESKAILVSIPSGTKTCWVPSSPPPRGRVVSTKLERDRVGTVATKRRVSRVTRRKPFESDVVGSRAES